jgi:TDG/mug DNA glycosylase family protein
MPTTPPSPLQVGLPPVIDEHICVLVLGSFPGEASLAAAQYYAHPRNQFWRLMSALLEEDLVALPYPDRLTRLLQRHIGLWDVIERCHRPGSLDSSIRHARSNDFSFLVQTCPRLKRVCFNGKASGKLEPVFAAMGYETVVLPSSSPANAQLSFDQKLALWRGIAG